MISEKKKEQLEAHMAALGLYEQDLVEHFVRSGGHGGQNVNKVSTCVYLKHLPSGLEVKCQKTRSQAENRFWARRWLVEKWEALKLGRESAAAKARFKIRKQKKKRSKRAKEKMIQEKRERSSLKKDRKPVKDWD